MRKMINKFMAISAFTALLLTNFVLTAAYTGGAVEETPADPVIPENPAPRKEDTLFAIPGNGELVDDKINDGSKEFLTVRTRNGNTFFLVLDRSGTAENVYMLSMIDEEDLAEFTEGAETEPAEKKLPQVFFPEFSPTPVVTVPAEPEREIQINQNSAAGSFDSAVIPVICLLFAGGTGILYYLKAVRPNRKKEEKSEDLEFYDGGPYINEEQEGDVWKEN